MCCEDIQIGRHTRSGESYPTIPATVGEIVPANPRRTALIIGAPAAGTLFAGIGTLLPVGIGQAISLNSGSLLLSLQEHGGCVREAWFGSIPAGAAQIAVIETALDDFCDGKSELHTTEGRTTPRSSVAMQQYTTIPS